MTDSHPIYRFAEAYLAMAQKAKYRPAAPGDGCGGIYLDEDQLRDETLLKEEALEYGKQFRVEEHKLRFSIGCSDYRTNRALVYCVEAARGCCTGQAYDHILRLLKLATDEVRLQKKQDKEYLKRKSVR